MNTNRTPPDYAEALVRLLDAVKALPGRGPQLYAFFGCMYYAAMRPADGPGCRQAVREVSEGPLSGGQQLSASRGERDASRFVAEQRVADLVFQTPDLLAQRGLCDAQAGSGVAEVEFLGEHEGVQLLKGKFRALHMLRDIRPWLWPNSTYLHWSPSVRRMTERRAILSGSTFEEQIGFARAVVDGDWVHVSGTNGFDYTTMTISDDVVDQAEQCLRSIEAALAEAKCTFDHVVRAGICCPTGRTSSPAGRSCAGISARSGRPPRC